jgi:hypothetical protein
MSGRDHWKQAASSPNHTKRQGGLHIAYGTHSAPHNGSHSVPDNGAPSVLDNDTGAHPVPHKRGPSHRGVRYAGDGAPELVLIVQMETWPRLRSSNSEISFDLLLLTTKRGWSVHTCHKEIRQPMGYWRGQAGGVASATERDTRLLPERVVEYLIGEKVTGYFAVNVIHYGYGESGPGSARRGRESSVEEESTQRVVD